MSSKLFKSAVTVKSAEVPQGKTAEVTQVSENIRHYRWWKNLTRQGKTFSSLVSG